MNLFSLAYQEILFRPLFNLLVGITNLLPFHNVGLAILLVTLIVRLLLLPFSLHQAKQAQRNQSKMGEVQKELKKIKEQYKNDKNKQAEATMALYRRAGINPASGCLPLLIQLPILIALYRAFFIGLGPETWQYLYSFVSQPANLNMVFFGLPLDKPSILLAVLTGATQFIMMKYFSATPAAAPGADDSQAQMMVSMQKNMAFIFPAMTAYIALRLPAALALYWVASTLFGIAQQIIVKRTLHLTSNIPTI